MEGKVTAITGASSGIGEAAAVLLAQRGAKIVLGARRSDKLGALAEHLTHLGAEVAYVQTDVARRADVEALVNLALERFGQLDVLISNAGIAPISPLDELRVDDWEAMVDVNIKSVLYGIAAALPVFRRQGFGHFINTASTSGLITKAPQSVYSATKFAVRALSEGLRQEAGENLRVTLITPGFVNTNLADSMTNLDARTQTRERMAQIAISPEAVARAMLYAIEQPANVDVGEIVIRPTAQG